MFPELRSHCLRRALCISALLCALLGSIVSSVAAQTRPFLYTVTSTTGQPVRSGVYSDFAFGHNLFAALGPEDIEQRMSVQMPLVGRFVGNAQVGWAASSPEENAAFQAEILADLAHPGSRVILAAGVGGMQDYDRIPAVLGRLVAGYRWAQTLAVANLRLEHAFPSADESLENHRDAVDIVSTLGVSRQATTHVRLGVETVAEDLEGFVESDEAEGGAKLMLGPTVGVGPRNAHWNTQVIAGYVLHLTSSSVSGLESGAPRDLTGTGYVVRASFGMQW
jgi:hypothetical protein